MTWLRVALLRSLAALAGLGRQRAALRRANLSSRVETKGPLHPILGGGGELGRALAIAHAAGGALELARIATIMNAPEAQNFAPLAWRLAESGLTPENARQALTAAKADTQAAAVMTDDRSAASAMLH